MQILLGWLYAKICFIGLTPELENCSSLVNLNFTTNIFLLNRYLVIKQTHSVYGSQMRVVQILEQSMDQLFAIVNLQISKHSKNLCRQNTLNYKYFILTSKGGSISTVAQVARQLIVLEIRVKTRQSTLVWTNVIKHKPDCYL